MRKILATGLAASPLSGTAVTAQDAPFGTQADATYARFLWDGIASSSRRRQRDHGDPL
ncbi:MAG: hypothetical protein WBN04_17845 [Paracoccaceae bacterium]